MRNIIAAILLIWPVLVSAESLVTESYNIGIKWLCGEGYVSCDNIEFEVLVKKPGSTNKYIGQSNHSLCADGVTPCKFQGYQFESDIGHFVIYSNGTLEVNEQSGQAIVEEKGQWQY